MQVFDGVGGSFGNGLLQLAFSVWGNEAIRSLHREQLQDRGTHLHLDELVFAQFSRVLFALDDERQRDPQKARPARIGKVDDERLERHRRAGLLFFFLGRPGLGGRIGLRAGQHPVGRATAPKEQHERSGRDQQAAT